MKLWRREDPRIRYYLYVSDTKLEMLFEQIDHSMRKRISAEVKVDLKLASVTLKRAEDPAPARMAKLRVVERFIDRHHHVGDVDEPGNEYFRGQMPMTWGWLSCKTDCDEHGVPRRDMVLFQGHQDQRAVGLAGSGRHVMSWNGIQDGTRSELSSANADILWALDQHVANTPELADLLQENKVRNPGPWRIRQRLQRPLTRDRTGFADILHRSLFRGLSQQLEFLAVPLAQADETVLGTPLYIALAPGSGTAATSSNGQ